MADGSLYVVTEFSPEPTLRDYLEEKSVTEVGALTIIRQAAEGLSALHALGVLHRNIRPENIILTTNAENRLLARIQNIDFGGIRQKIISSRMGQNLSDLRYFSPEQCAGHSIEAQTDVYSLGIVLYEIIAGNPPFDAPDADVLINKQINETTPPIKIKNFDIRALLTHTLTDSLQKMTRLRLKTASIFARRIRHIEQIATHSSTPPPVMSYAVTANNPVIISPPKFENPVAVENQIFVEKSSLLEETVIENPLSFESQTVAEKDEMPAAISFDYTTNELPPIESIIGNPLPENDLEK
ncbi:MAG: protein kinase [Blastocatellia bacterium]|nr:protein kinase [Blastocatellia bacterium]